MRKIREVLRLKFGLGLKDRDRPQLFYSPQQRCQLRFQSKAGRITYVAFGA